MALFSSDVCGIRGHGNTYRAGGLDPADFGLAVFVLGLAAGRSAHSALGVLWPAQPGQASDHVVPLLAPLLVLFVGDSWIFV